MLRGQLLAAVWTLVALTVAYNASGQNRARSINVPNYGSIGYLEHLPSQYDQNTDRYPVLIFLHGAGERGSDLNRVKKNGPPKYIEQGHPMSFSVNGQERSLIVISPQLRAKYNSWPAFYVDLVVEHVKKTYRVDEDQIFLSGLSLGGGACWTYTSYKAEYAKKIAAIVPICGHQAFNSSKVCNIGNNGVAVWALHGDADRNTPLRYSQDWVNGVNRCATKPAKLTVYPGVGHGGAWQRGYKTGHEYHNPNIYEWLLQQRRGTAPSPAPSPAPAPTPAPPNQSPVAKAGADVSVQLPTAQIVLDGNQSVDPDGTIASYTWIQINGSTSVSLAGQRSQKLTITDLKAGNYTFELQVTDDRGATATDRVAVAVAAAVAPPTPSPTPSSDCGCDHTITAATPYVNGERLGVKPGDVVCIQAGDYPYLNLFNFQGSAEQPLLFKNCGGQVRVGEPSSNYGIVMNNNRHFRFTGTGDSNHQYGFKVSGKTKYLPSGFAIATKSSDFEIDHLEITKVGAGVLAKTNPSCDASTWNGNYVMRNVKFHDFYIHDITGEGFYIGHTSLTVDVKCDGTTQKVVPHDIEGIRVYDNVVKQTGWDGIQVSRASKDCQIYNNRVYDYGTANHSSQQAGIIVGGESTGKVYNNWVEKGTGSGIQVFGTGNVTVYNNVITDAGADAIFCDDRSPKPMSARFINNTIVNPGRDGIRLYNDEGIDNVVYNNLVVTPGSLGDYSDKTRSYLFVANGVDLSQSTNHFSATANKVNFEDHVNDDFQLEDGSPAINAGTNVSQYGIVKDMEGNDRPANGAYDIGAFEAVLETTPTPQPEPTPTPQPEPAPTPEPAPVPSDKVAGLNYSYYEGIWSVLPEFADLTAVKTGTVSNFDLSVREQDSNFGVVFTGYIDVPTAGKYTFVTGSDDGSKLYIDGRQVVNNDGLHGLREREGTVTLTKGLHPITVSFFERLGREKLNVYWKNTAHGVTTAQRIPAQVLFTEKPGTLAPADVPQDTPSASGRVFQINATKVSGATSLKGWYNMALDGFNGTRTFANVTDREGKTSEMSITAYNGIQGASIIGVADNQNTLAGGIYPSEVLRHAAYTTGTATITLSNLDRNKGYHVTVHGGRTGSGSKVTNYTVNGASKSLQCINNEDQVVTFSAVTPDAQGNVVIRFAQGGNTWGYLNAIVVEEITTSNLRTAGTTASKSATPDELTVPENAALMTKVYPNPFAGHFTLDLSNYQDEEVTVTLFDQVGNLVMTKALTRPWSGGSWQEELRPELARSGVHVLRVQSVTRGAEMIRIVSE